MSLVTTVLNAAPRASMILLNRPPVNAMNRELLSQLAAAVRSVEKEKGDQGWGLVLASAFHSNSPVFTAGLDLAEMHNKPASSVATFWGALQDVFVALYGTKLATVCALSGTSPAGGCFLATLCDWRVGANDLPRAVIGLNEAKFGLVAPGWFAAPLATCVGARKAEKMLQLGELVPFADAHRAGLIDELVARDKVISVALDRASEWASNGPANARHLSKLTTRQALLDTLKTPEQRKADADLFVGRVSEASVQAALDTYLANLKKR